MGRGQGQEHTKRAMRHLHTLYFAFDYLPDGHGINDYENDEGEAYTARVYIKGQEAGWVDYNFISDNDTGGTLIHLRWIEVRESFRRQGVARALLDRIHERHPEALFQTNSTTPDGDSLWESYSEEHSYVLPVGPITSY